MAGDITVTRSRPGRMRQNEAAMQNRRAPARIRGLLRLCTLHAAPGADKLMLTRVALALMWLLGLQPLALRAGIGNGLAPLLCALARERRRVCLINLARCLPELSAGGREALAR